MASKAAELYDLDFYAWTRQQAEAIRSLRGDNRLDVDHLAEEIEDLGSSRLNACQSYLAQIIAHLLKLNYSGLELPRRRWRAEVVAFRQNLRRKMSPTIRNKLEDGIDEIYRDAVALASTSLEAEPDLEDRLPKENPYTLDEILTRDPFEGAG